MIPNSEITKEIIDVEQTLTVNTEAELKQAILDRLPLFQTEIRKSANGRTFTVTAESRTDDDGTRYAHLSMRYLDEPVKVSKVIKTSTVVIEAWDVGIYDSPAVEAG